MDEHLKRLYILILKRQGQIIQKEMPHDSRYYYTVEYTYRTKKQPSIMYDTDIDITEEITLRPRN